jgi:hypothetical protein
MRTAVEESDGELTLVRSMTRAPAKDLPSVQETVHEVAESEITETPTNQEKLHHQHSPFHHDPNHVHRSIHERAHDFRAERVKRKALKDKHKTDVKHPWWPTFLNLLRAFWKFFKTPAGFLITIYFLNIVVRAY